MPTVADVLGKTKKRLTGVLPAFLEAALLGFMCLSCGCPKQKTDGELVPVDLNPVGTRYELQIEGKVLLVECALTGDQRSLGFMFRHDIPRGTGMLFVYPESDLLSFYMKNTPTPLSIAFIDSKGLIFQIADMEPFSLEPVRSTEPARYALEVPRGYFRTIAIKTGSRMVLTPEIRAVIKDASD